MAMDDETLTLVLEFLLRQPIPNLTLSVLVSALPLPRTLSLRLFHSILLRHLTFPFSDETLTSLELLHQFHNNSVSLQTAYSAVAVYLTVRLLQNDDVAGFGREVESLWRKRIGDLEKGGEKGLVAEGLRRERRKMEMAVGSEMVREELMRRDVSKMAAEAVEIFLKEAEEGLGLTGLEVAAEVVRQREAHVRGECSGSGFDYVLNQKVIYEKHQGEQGFGNDYVMAEEPLPVCTEVTEKTFPTYSKDPSETGRNEVLVPAAEAEAGEGGECMISGFTQQPVPKPIQSENHLKPGNEKNPGMTNELLPEVETAKTSEVEKENHSSGGIEHTTDAIDGSNTTKTIDRHKTVPNDVPKPNAVERETNQSSSCRITRLHSQDKGKKPSIMERNPTARTYEWHENSPNPSLEEESPISKKKRCIPATSLPPFDISVGGAVKKEWTLDEEDSLRKAVAEHGTGNWNLIRNTYPEFQGRTLEGVRNKWRHMNKKLRSKKS